MKNMLTKLSLVLLTVAIPSFAAFSPGPAYNDDDLAHLNSPSTALTNLGAGFTNAAAAGWDAVAVTYTIP